MPLLGLGASVSGSVLAIAMSHDFDGAGNPAMLLGTEGGIWRSTNFTSKNPSWSPLTDELALSGKSKKELLEAITIRDGFNLPLHVSSIDIHPDKPRLLYAAMGAGIMKSTDGDSWNLVYPNNKKNLVYDVAKLFLDPTDASGETIYALGEVGPPGQTDTVVYKTSDDGTSWIPGTGNLKGFHILDLDYTFDGKNLALYAAALDSTNPQNNGIWTRTNGGTSWSRVDMTFTDVQGKPADLGSIYWIKLATDRSPGGTNRVYALIMEGDNKASYLINVFKLINNSFNPVGKGLPKVQFNGTGSIGVSSAGTVCVGGVNAYANGLYKLDEGQSGWQSIDLGSNNIKPHTDQHAWAFHGEEIYGGNDGGIWRFKPGPGTWESLNTDSLKTHLANGAGQHPTDPNILLVASQDNGTSLRSSGGWKYVGGGDTASVRFDPDPNKGANNGEFAYFTQPTDYADPMDKKQIHFFFRSQNFGNSFDDFSKNVPGNPGLGGMDSFFLKFAIDPLKPYELFLGLGEICATPDGETWSIISPWPSYNSGASALSVFGNHIWVAYDQDVFKSDNGGGNGTWADWSQISQSDWGDNGPVTSIAIDPANLNEVYLATSTGRIWRTPDDGATWDDITGSLPSQLPIRSMALKQGVGGADPYILLGTDAGVYISIDQHENLCWQRFGNGMPDVQVTDLHFNGANNSLAAATHGRGVFLASIETYEFPTVKIKIKTDECGLGPREGEKVILKLALFGGFDASKMEYKWTAAWDDPKPIGMPVMPDPWQHKKGHHYDHVLHGNQSEFSFTAPSPPVPVLVDVEVTDAEGCKMLGTLTFMPLSQQEWSAAQPLCALVKWVESHPYLREPVPPPDPSLEPTPESIARPFSNPELREIQMLAGRIIDAAQKLLELEASRGEG